MKAAIFHGAGEALTIDDWPTPDPGPGEMRVKVTACGVCHTDLHYLDHGTPTARKPPLVLGHEAAGTVDALGEGVTGWHEGDSVLLPAVLTCGSCRECRLGRENICANMRMYGNHIDGAYAEYVIAPARDAFHLPPTIPRELGCIIADAISTPYHAVVRRGQVRPGDRVVVVGCGGVGLNVVQLASVAGGRVIAVDRHAGRLTQARALGAAETIDVTNIERPDKAVREITDGGADIVFEAVGCAATLDTALGCVRRGGRLVVIGYSPEKASWPAGKIMFHELEVIGSLGCRPVDYPPLIELVAAGKVRLEPLVTGQFALDDIDQALDRLRAGEGIRSVILP